MAQTHYYGCTEFVAFLFFIHHFNLTKVANIELWNISIVLIILILIAIAWFISTKPEKTKKGKIGFVIAISSEDENQKRLVEQDFVRNIRDVLDTSRAIADFHIISLPSVHSKQIVDVESATKYIGNCKARLLMYGDTRKRTKAGKNVYIFRLKQMVLHREIPIETGNDLSVELSQIFPGKILISVDQELDGLEVTSNWMGEAAKYFVAMAAIIGGNLNLAENLLLDIRKSIFLKNIKDQKGVARIRSKANGRLCDIYNIQGNHCIYLWRTTHNDEEMNVLGKILDNQRSICGESYTWRVRKAIWYFVVKEDVENALKMVKKCKGQIDASWRYSWAFLSAFDGNLSEAKKIYDMAFTKPAHDGISLEVEEFINWAINKYTDKCQLYYCLGYLNYRLKNDSISMARDFTSFLSCPDVDNNYPNQARFARECIANKNNNKTII